MRVTAQRLAVLALLRDSGGHLPVEEILRQSNLRLQSISTQAVYNALSALCAAGFVRRVEFAGSAALYEAQVADNHHHVVCRSCRAVADVSCVVGASPCLDPASTGGFVVDEAEVTFWGLCPGCQRKPVPVQPESTTNSQGA
jgi:Fur family ferric uptake transcriptional regulator